MLARDILDERRLPSNLDELLPGVSILVQVPNFPRGHLLGQGNADSVVNPLEPNCDVRNESNRDTKSSSYLTFVDMVSQAVRHQVVLQLIDVILGTWLCSSPRITRYTKYGGRTSEVRH